MHLPGRLLKITLAGENHSRAARFSVSAFEKVTPTVPDSLRFDPRPTPDSPRQPQPTEATAEPVGGYRGLPGLVGAKSEFPARQPQEGIESG
jgi:hypothetical protein